MVCTQTAQALAIRNGASGRWTTRQRVPPANLVTGPKTTNVPGSVPVLGVNALQQIVHALNLLKTKGMSTNLDALAAELNWAVFAHLDRMTAKKTTNSAILFYPQALARASGLKKPTATHAPPRPSALLAPARMVGAPDPRAAHQIAPAAIPPAAATSASLVTH